MEVSCVIPLHNKAPTIRRALRSALAQTHACREILVVDDASEDNGLERVMRLGHPGVRILRRNQPGPGGYAARNLAIRAARCRWIAFLDADDFWSPTHLERLIGVLRRRPGAGGAFAGRYDRWPEGDKPAPIARRLRAEPAPLLDFEAIVRAWLAVGDCPVWTSASLFRRDLLERAGLFPEHGPQRGGDKDLWLRLAYASPLTFSGVRSAVFDRTAPNKVTHRIATTTLPCVNATIERLLSETANPTLRRLLRRLANQEIRLYARQAVRRGPPPQELRRALYLPEGWSDYALLTGLRLTQPALVRVLRVLS